MSSEEFELTRWVGGATAYIFRRPGPTNPLLSCLFGLLLFAQASALPMHLGFFIVGPDAHAMTEGCEKGTCCTALCYLDKHGIHHCVHEHGDSCGCDISANDFNANSIFLSAVVTLPQLGSLIPDLTPSGRILQTPGSIESRDITTSTPPPK